jgi:hypothetical protein
MKTLLFWLSLLSSSLICIANSVSIADSIELIAKVEASPYPKMPGDDDLENDTLLLEYTIEIRNIGTSAIKVPTLGFERLTTGTENSINSKICWSLNVICGLTTIVPETNYGFVILRQNERTFVNWKEIEFREERLKKIDIEYIVKKDFGERFQSWFGIKHISCEAHPKNPLKTWRRYSK